MWQCAFRSSIQSARGLAQSKTWRICGVALGKGGRWKEDVCF